jgi:hypothetical protein
MQGQNFEALFADFDTDDYPIALFFENMKMKSKHIIEEKNARSDLIMMN